MADDWPDELEAREARIAAERERARAALRPLSWGRRSSRPSPITRPLPSICWGCMSWVSRPRTSATSERPQRECRRVLRMSLPTKGQRMTEIEDRLTEALIDAVIDRERIIGWLVMERTCRGFGMPPVSQLPDHHRALMGPMFVTLQSEEDRRALVWEAAVVAAAGGAK